MVISIYHIVIAIQTIYTFPMQVLYTPSMHSSANEHIRIGPAKHKAHFMASLDRQLKPTNHKRPLSKAGDVLLLSTYTSFTHTHSAEE